MPSTKPKYFNSIPRAKSIKDSVESLRTYSLNTKGRMPNREEQNAIISLSLPLDRDNNKK